MIHDGQRLPFRLEAGDHLARVHARLEDLQGDLAADRLGLLGHEDHAEAAFADLFEKFVMANDRTGPLAQGTFFDGGTKPRSRGLQETTAFAVRGQ